MQQVYVLDLKEKAVRAMNQNDIHNHILRNGPCERVTKSFVTLLNLNLSFFLTTTAPKNNGYRSRAI